MTNGARVMQANQPQYFIIENYGHHEQRARSQTLRKETHFMIVLKRGSIIEPDWFFEVQILRECRHVDWYARIQTRGDGFRGAPFMTDAELAFRIQLDNVTAIDFHHPAQFGHDNFQKR